MPWRQCRRSWTISMRTDDDAPTIPGLTTDIVVAYLGHHAIATADVGRLITTVAQELNGLGHEPEPPAGHEPAVPVRQSIKRDHLVCLVCGKPFKSLRRHLQSAHGLTAAAYRQMFELARDYPMVAAASTEQRAAIARRTGLGQRRTVEPEAAVEAEPVIVAATAPQPAPRPVRGRRAPKRASGTTATDPARQPQPEPEPEPRRTRRPKSDTTSS
jgi:predicted transcriptional regulator